MTCNTVSLEEHQKDVHGKKVRCGICYNFVFPESCWRSYREHHHEQHPEQDFGEYVPLDFEPPRDDLEDWEIPPEEGFLELGSPVFKEESTLYSPISSDSLSSVSEWETLSEVESQGKHEESVLYSPISSSSFASESEWETVSEVDFQDVQAITDVTE